MSIDLKIRGIDLAYVLNDSTPEAERIILAELEHVTQQLREDRDMYKKLYQRSKTVIAKPCINCKYVQKRVTIAKDEAT